MIPSGGIPATTAHRLDRAAKMKWAASSRRQRQSSNESSGPQKRDGAVAAGIGKYMLCEKVLGAGATSRVCKATCITSGMEVAIKIIAARSHIVQNEVAAMHRAARHGHPNICGFIEHCRQGDMDYLVLEYCSAGELFSTLEAAGSLLEPEAQSLSRGLVAGVRFIHSRGVAHRYARSLPPRLFHSCRLTRAYHTPPAPSTPTAIPTPPIPLLRDLKLENLLLVHPAGNPGGAQLKICDFGLACVYDPHLDGLGFSRPPLRARCGTRSYTAPEMLAGEAYDGFAVDIW